jgi:hypothetical protein
MDRYSGGESRFSDIFFYLFFQIAKGRVEMDRYSGGESRFSDISPLTAPAQSTLSPSIHSSLFSSTTLTTAPNSEPAAAFWGGGGGGGGGGGWLGGGFSQGIAN